MAENKPHPGIAAVLSFIFNGLGQVYNGEIKKGLLLIFLSALCMLLMVVGGILAIFWLAKGSLVSRPFIASLLIFVLGVILAAVIGVFSIFDAYQTARKLNE
jgi:predicted neutral ceramidase superfamily lipid hydrolase